MLVPDQRWSGCPGAQGPHHESHYQFKTLSSGKTLISQDLRSRSFL